MHRALFPWWVARVFYVFYVPKTVEKSSKKEVDTSHWFTDVKSV